MICSWEYWKNCLVLTWAPKRKSQITNFVHLPFPFVKGWIVHTAPLQLLVEDVLIYPIQVKPISDTVKQTTDHGIQCNMYFLYISVWHTYIYIYYVYICMYILEHPQGVRVWMGLRMVLVWFWRDVAVQATKLLLGCLTSWELEFCSWQRPPRTQRKSHHWGTTKPPSLTIVNHARKNTYIYMCVWNKDH